jgi:hypothetical protein
MRRVDEVCVCVCVYVCVCVGGVARGRRHWAQQVQLAVTVQLSQLESSRVHVSQQLQLWH